MHRIFLAINLGDDMKVALGDFVRQVKPRHEVMRPPWVDPRSFHLTLHFFGELDDTGLAATPRLRAESLGYLPSGRTPRVLYLGFSLLPEKVLDPVIVAARRLAGADSPRAPTASRSRVGADKFASEKISKYFKRTFYLWRFA